MWDETPLFDELWDYSQPKETAVRLSALLPLAEAGADRSYHVQLLTQLARTQSLQSRFAAAHQWLDQAAALLTPDMTIARIRYLLERGRTYNSARQPEQATPLFRQAWEMAAAAQIFFYAVDAAHMMGIVEPRLERQLTWHETALTWAEQSRNLRTRQWLGALYNNIGWSYHGAGQYTEALVMFQKALHWRQTEADPRQEGPMRIARWCVARALRSLGRVEEALAQQQSLLADGSSSDGYVYEEVGECLLALGQAEAARPFFQQAYVLLSPNAWLRAHESERLTRLHTLSQD